MRLSEYRIFSALIILITAAFPLFQIFHNGGYLFYTNGWDEASYLQYDYAKHVIEIAAGGRISEYIVILMHELGLSAGYINLLFDLLTGGCLLYLLPGLIEKTGVSLAVSRALTISLLGLPLLLSNVNPVFELKRNFYMQSEAISWLTMPYIKDPFWLRTPEPQFSLMLLLISACVFIKLNMPVLIIPIICFNYPFLLLPLLFMYSAFFLSKKMPLALASLMSALLISSALLIYRIYFLPSEVVGYIIPTHLPLLSVSGLFAVLIVILLPKPLSKLILLLTLSIWFATNFQIISGFTIQPNNFEQYYSAAAVSLIFLFAIKDSRYFKFMPALSMSLIIFWAVKNFNINYQFAKQIDLTDTLLTDIKTDASKVAVPDIFLSTRLDMLFPKQKLLLFSYTRFYKKLPEMLINDYLCAREALKENARYEEVFKLAAEYYKSGDKNYQMNTIGRVNHVAPTIDLTRKTAACEVKGY